MNAVLCARGALVGTALAAGVLLANTPPTVSAEPDTSTRLGRQFRLQGAVSDDGVGGGSLVVRWTQVTGPAGGATIVVEDALRSLIGFSATGEYRFRLWASDGEQEAQDEVLITVLDSIQFEVLSPRPGDTLVRGAICEVSWQIDPPGTDVVVGYSIDDGDSFVTITPNRTTAAQFAWRVPADLPPDGRVIIRVTNYFAQSRYAQSASLVVSTAISSVRRRPDRQSLPQVTADGTMRVVCADATARLEILGLSGRFIGQASAADARFEPMPHAAGAIAYRLRTGGSTVARGSLLLQGRP